MEAFAAFTLLASFLWTCAASPTPVAELEDRVAPPLPVSTIYNLPAGTAPVNFVTRPNGKLLVNVVSLNAPPAIYQIDPSKQQSGGPITSFPEYVAIFGITELKPDLYYTVFGNFTGPPLFAGVKGTFAIWEVDLRGVADATKTKTRKVVDVPTAQFLNEITPVNAAAGLLYASDRQDGVLYLIDVKKGTAKAVQSDSIYLGTNTTLEAGEEHVGLDALAMQGSTLFFTSSAKGIFGSVSVNPITGQPTGKPKALSDYGQRIDSFVFDAAGNALIAVTNLGVIVRRVGTPAGNDQVMVLAKQTGVTSDAFGRTLKDKCVLYTAFFTGPPAAPAPVAGIIKINTLGQGLCGGL